MLYLAQDYRRVASRYSRSVTYPASASLTYLLFQITVKHMLSIILMSFIYKSCYYEKLIIAELSLPVMTALVRSCSQQSAALTVLLMLNENFLFESNYNF